MDSDEIILVTEEKMEKAVDALRESFKRVRTGRASSGLVEKLKVEYYGTQTDLIQLATISVPEPQMMVLKPFDPSSLPDIEKAIQKSDIGITPANDGKVVRLSFPPMSEERRRKMVSLIKDQAEQAKVSIRNTRRESNKIVDGSEKDSVLTEDDAERCKKEIQNLTKKSEDAVDHEFKKKSDELMTV